MSQAREAFAVAEEFLARHPDVQSIDLLLPDINGVLRGKRVERDELGSIYERGMLLPGSMFALDIQGGTIQASGLGFDEGDADRACMPVPGSLCATPWLGTEIAQLQVQMLDHDGTPFHGDPRHVLGSIVERLRARGLNPVVAVELEFYFVDRERTVEGNAQPPRSRLTGRREYRTQINSMIDLQVASPILREIVDTCRLQDVPAGGSLAEYGPGQYEVNLKHVPDAVLACDHATRFKRIVKGVALKHGLEATFMAKPYADMAGSGAHVHVSLVDEAGRNAFASDEPLAHPLLRSAAAGLLATMAEGMALFAPNANSYRRFRPESYVPMHACWGYNNRGVAVRVPVSGPEDRRLEHRVAGADVNPYLLVATVLAGMLAGIENGLAPPPPLEGNAYQERRGCEPLPAHWPLAIERFAAGSLLKPYLGERFCRLYEAVKRGELDDFSAYISPLEYAWYLEPV